jgi:site-specific DNA-methyltransferase (adenine-specific)
VGVTVASGEGWTLYLGRYQDVLGDVKPDLVCADPPYGARTHDGHNDGGPQIVSVTWQSTREAISYAHWTDDDVCEFVDFFAERTRGWMACMTSHDLFGSYEGAYRANGRYAFAPVGIIQKRPRLLGDGPSSWLVHLAVSRPRNVEFARWGCLPGTYEANTCRDTKIAGAKPVDLMRAIVRDYSRPGDLVCDPCAGGGSTLIAAVMEGRRAIGCEMDEGRFEIARKRLEALKYTAISRSLFEATSGEQMALGGEK